MRALDRLAGLVPASAWLVLATSGCGTLLGYDDLKPWPEEAGRGGRDAEGESRDAEGESAVVASDARAPTHCAEPLVTNDPCQAIWRMTNPQVVDGEGSEFCDVPPFEFDVKQARASIPSPALDLPEHVVLRAAWSDESFHLHVHVIDPNVIVRHDDLSFDGDAVEVFIAGPSPYGYLGPYNGSADGGATQIVLSPPNPPEYPEADGRAWWNPPNQHNVAPLIREHYAGRRVSDGYELELQFPWPSSAGPRYPSAQIAFTLSVDVQEDVDAGGRQMQAFLNLASRDGAEVCGFSGSRPAEPYCDDRTWCTPVLK